MKITVFTPTYNRAGTIERLYRSLQKQSFKDFEWLVIDDGSTDNTRELFERNWLIEKNDFPIKYFYANNKGKMKEMNAAMDMAQGELFFTVDSDDWLELCCLDEMYGKAEQYRCDIVSCNCTRDFPDGRALKVNNRELEEGLFIKVDDLEKRTPLSSRKHTLFKDYFDKIWRDLDVHI